MLKYYLGNAIRQFRRHWVTAAVNLAGLTLGFACFIAALSAVHYFDLDDQHFPGADRTYLVTHRIDDPVGRQDSGMPHVPWVTADLIKANIPEIEAVARITDSEHRSIAANGIPSDVQARYVDAEFLKLFPLVFVDGNISGALANPNDALITDTAAIRMFGTTQAVGRTVLMDGRDALTITGVFSLPIKPSHLVSKEGPRSMDIEMLISMDTLLAVTERNSGPQAVARLRSWRASTWTTTYIRLSANGAVALADVVGRLERLAKNNGGTSRDMLGTMSLPEYRKEIFQSASIIRATSLDWSTVTLLFAGLIVLVSCLNYANLSIAIATAHAKELGVRRVLGATPLQLLVQHLVDAGSVAITALVIALLTVAAATPLLRTAFEFAPIYAWTHSFSFWAELLGVALAATIVCAAIPCYATFRTHLASSLQRSRGGVGSTLGSRWLVGAQFFVAGTLFIVSLVFLSQQREIILSARANIPGSVIAITSDLKRSGVNFQTLRSELLLQPSIESVGASRAAPWGKFMILTTYARAPDPESTESTVMIHFVSRNFFSTMGIKLLSGSLFDELDPSPRGGDQSGIVIDRSTANRFGFDSPQSAVGQSLYPTMGDRGTSIRIVGVVEDKPLAVSPGRFASTVYIDAQSTANVPLVRVRPDRLSKGAAEIQAVWSALAPNFALRTLFVDEAIENYSAEQRPYVSLLGGLTLMSFAISMAGFLGMSIYVASRRQHEIGVRKTLGARTGQIVRMLLSDFARPVLIGSIVSWPLAYFMGQIYLNTFVKRIGLSPLFFIGSLFVTMTAACAVVAWCAIRSAKTNPAHVLRHE
jgi:putative ABC transport system permease protein